MVVQQLSFLKIVQIKSSIFLQKSRGSNAWTNVHVKICTFYKTKGKCQISRSIFLFVNNNHVSDNNSRPTMTRRRAKGWHIGVVRAWNCEMVCCFVMVRWISGGVCLAGSVSGGVQVVVCAWSCVCVCS